MSASWCEHVDFARRLAMMLTIARLNVDARFTTRPEDLLLKRPSDDDPHAWLAAFDVWGERLARVRVAPNFKRSVASARRWIERDFREP